MYIQSNLLNLLIETLAHLIAHTIQHVFLFFIISDVFCVR